MAVVRVFRTTDRRYRVEVHDDGKVDLVQGGFLLVRRGTLERVGRRLAELGVSANDLIED